jgi:hypothetical protein
VFDFSRFDVLSEFIKFANTPGLTEHIIKIEAGV